MNAVLRGVVFAATAVIAAPGWATSSATASVSSFQAQFIDLDPSDGIDPTLGAIGTPTLFERLEYSLGSANGQPQGWLQVYQFNLAPLTLDEPYLSTFGGKATTSFAGGLTGAMNASTGADVGSSQAYASLVYQVILSPRTSAVFSATLSYATYSAGAPSGGNSPYALAGTGVSFDVGADPTQNSSFELYIQIAPLQPSFEAVSASASEVAIWTFRNDSGAPAVAEIEMIAYSWSVGTVATVPESSTGSMLVAGLASLLTIVRAARKARSRKPRHARQHSVASRLQLTQPHHA